MEYVGRNARFQGRICEVTSTITLNNVVFSSICETKDENSASLTFLTPSSNLRTKNEESNQNIPQTRIDDEHEHPQYLICFRNLVGYPDISFW